MNKYLLLMLVFLIQFLVNFLWGQTHTLTLEACIKHGQENRIEHKIKALEIEYQKALKPSQWSNLLPKLDFSGLHSYNFGSTIDPETNTRVSSNFQTDQFYLNSSMTLVSPYDIQKTRVDQQQIQLSEASYEKMEAEYIKMLIDYYFQGFAAQAYYSICQQQLENSKTQADFIVKEVALGNRPKSDEASILWVLSKSEVQCQEAKQVFQEATRALFTFIQMPSNATDIYHFQVPLANENSIQKASVLSYYQMNVALKHKEMNLIKAKQLPSLHAYYNYSTFYFNQIYPDNKIVAPWQSQLNNNGYQQIGLLLQVPLFDGFRNVRARNQAKIGQEIAQKQLELAEIENRQKENEINTQLLHFQALQQELDKALQYATSTHQAALLNFKLGTIDIQSYTTTHYQFLNSQLAALKNQINIWRLLALKARLSHITH
jgi:outer membrane protein